MRSLKHLPLLLATLLLVPACGGSSGGSGGNSGVDGDPALYPDILLSEFRVTPSFGSPADGTAEVEIEVRLINSAGNEIAGAEVLLAVSGTGNRMAPLPPTDATGRTSGRLASSVGERKTLTLHSRSGGAPSQLGPLEVEFLVISDRARFVRTSGSDANDGRSPRAAWRTLAHALAQADPGATIHVGAGHHAGALTLGLDSAQGVPLHIRGDRDGRMTGDAGLVVLEAGGSPWVLRLLGARNVLLDGLVLRGAESGLLIEDCREVLVLDCRLEENDVGLTLAGVEDVSIQDCRISSNRIDGARLGPCSRVRLENSILYANEESALVLQAPCEDLRILYCTFYRNGRNHVQEVQPGGSGRIEGNILAESGGDALALDSAGRYQVLSNLVWDEGTLEGREAPDGSINADPLFLEPSGEDGILGGVGAGDDDFRLLPASKAIDSGVRRARDVLLTSGESLATRTTRSDDVLEHSLDDGEASNLGFHTALTRPRFEALAPGGGRLAHALPGDVRIHARRWDPALPNRAIDVLTPALAAEVVYLEQRNAPLGKPQEILSLQIDTGGTGQILVRAGVGGHWGDAPVAPMRSGIPREELDNRLFDVEYEHLSGRALLVLADGDGLPSYRLLERGAWSVEAPVAMSPNAAGRIRWVELVPRQGSDEIALVILDDRRDLFVTLWDGQSFGLPLLLEQNTLFSSGWRPFDAAFESLSGDLLVCWGFTAFAEETRWATLERGSGEWRFGQLTHINAVGAHIVLAADPRSERIVLAAGEADLDNDVAVSVWTGTEWSQTAELTLSGPLASHLLEVAWIGDTGLALTIFRRQGNKGTFNAALLQPSGWRIMPEVALSGVGKAVCVRLVSFENESRLLGLLLDETGSLFGIRFEGERFALLNGGTPLASGLDPLAPGRAFDVDVRAFVDDL